LEDMERAVVLAARGMSRAESTLGTKFEARTTIARH